LTSVSNSLLDTEAPTIQVVNKNNRHRPRPQRIAGGAKNAREVEASSPTYISAIPRPWAN